MQEPLDMQGKEEEEEKDVILVYQRMYRKHLVNQKRYKRTSKEISISEWKQFCDNLDFVALLKLQFAIQVSVEEYQLK